MQRGQLQGQQQAAPNGTNPQQRTGTPSGTQGPSPPAQITNGQVGTNIPQQRPPSQNMMQNGFNNGTMNAMGLNIPQAQMQAMQSQQRMSAQGSSQENIQRMIFQQRAYQNQTQHGGQSSNLAVAHLGNTMQNNPQMMAAMAAQRAKNSTPNGIASLSMPSTSPRTHPSQSQLTQQPQPLSSGHIPALYQMQQQVASQFPHFTNQEVQVLANERLKGHMQRMQASALSAASGSPAPPMGNSSPMPQLSYSNGTPGGSNGMAGANGMSIGNNGMQGPHSPTQYQQQLHRNIQQQAAAARMGSGSPGMSNARPGSRSATPQNSQGQIMQRSLSTASGNEGSPQLMQAQMARP